LQEVARWPWSRDVMARVIRMLFDKYQVAVVAFDVAFAEADYSSGIHSLDEMAKGALRDGAEFSGAY